MIAWPWRLNEAETYLQDLWRRTPEDGIINLALARLAARAGPWIGKLGMLILVLGAVPILIKVWPAEAALIGDGTVIAIVAIVIAALLGGQLLGGPDPANKPALSVAAAIRQPGIALAIANANLQDKRVSAAILLYLIVSFLVVTAYRLYMRRSHRAGHHPGHAAPV